MPITIKELDGGIGVLISGRGVIRDSEYVSVIEAHLCNKELLRKCRYNISDFSDVTEVLVGAEALERVVEMCKPIAADYPKAILAQIGQQDIIYGLQRMWQTYADDLPWEVETFRDRKSAEKWVKAKVAERFGTHLTIKFA